jgi:hypothetical protein
MTTDSKTARRREGPLALLRRAAGDRQDVADKLRRLARALRTIADGPALDARLERLRELGYVDQVPTRLQLVVGSIDMLRFWITPAAAEYYASQDIHFGFHQILRILEEPASMVDPTGLFTERDVIIDHLLQVTHANPAYDLQLLESHADGIAELLQQVEAATRGAHPKQSQLEATIEDPDYYGRLLGYAENFSRDRFALPPLRDNIQSPKWVAIEQTFGTLPAALRYCAQMPKRPLAAARHLLLVRTFSVYEHSTPR